MITLTLKARFKVVKEKRILNFQRPDHFHKNQK